MLMQAWLLEDPPQSSPEIHGNIQRRELGQEPRRCWNRMTAAPTSNVRKTAIPIVGGSWLNMAESIQRVTKRRALAGQHPHSPAENRALVRADGTLLECAADA